MGTTVNPVIFDQSPPRKAFSWKSRFSVLCGWITAYLLIRTGWIYSYDDWNALPNFKLKADVLVTKDLCTQAPPLTPHTHAELYKNLSGLYESAAFKLTAVQALGGAVQVPTESYDGMAPVGQDARWEVFGKLHEYLLAEFPLVHSSLKVTKVNTYGIVYHWQGTDKSLKPILLAAHQDVVPVDPLTVKDWVHPPYSGYYDGTYVWGRGSVDDKASLVAILVALETLLASGFVPERSIVVAFGFDEESSGTEGAGRLFDELVSQYGKDSFAFLVDEGAGFGEFYGGLFAIPAIGEKGYLDVKVEVSSPGGHSSVPPRHTSIGILASMLVKYESEPYPAVLNRATPFYQTLTCIGAYAQDISEDLRKLILASIDSDVALTELSNILVQDPLTEAQVGTTQAIDLINGGVKTNALPESAWAIINHRIAVDSSVKATMERSIDLLLPLASKFNLSVTAFGENITDASVPSYGSLTLTDAFDGQLEPAPITPTDSASYRLLSGTILATHKASSAYKNLGREMVIAPGMMTGNTDTKFYWDITRNIYRYGHSDATAAYAGIHTINEAYKASALVEQVRFFTTLILNADEAPEL
ncbi:carboxypeptidase S, partial [Sistotremastrum niveocremeum HHB9708]